MNRINSSRQTLSSKQRNCNYHPDGRMAAHVSSETVARESRETVIEEEGRYLVASAKFVGQYYIVADGRCSASDERVARMCIAKVQAYRENVA